MEPKFNKHVLAHKKLQPLQVNEAGTNAILGIKIGLVFLAPELSPPLLLLPHDLAPWGCDHKLGPPLERQEQLGEDQN